MIAPSNSASAASTLPTPTNGTRRAPKAIVGGRLATTRMELPLIFSLFGAVALTLVVPAIRGMYRR